MSFGMLGWVLAGVAFYIMYTVKYNRRRLLDSQGKMAALLMVIMVVGIMLLMGNYNRIQMLFWKPIIVDKPMKPMNEHSFPNVAQGDSPMHAPVQTSKVTAPKPLDVHHDGGPLGVTPSHAPTNTAFYGIIFDAGSTGTRIHCFTFIHRAAGQPIELKDEYFEEVKPGLSSYADKPSDAMAGVRKMLDKCREIIPEASWKKTPIALKATAGLRLLPKEKADALLLEVVNTFKSYPFLMGPKEESVSIMDGEDEGVFSWFTVNYLLGNMVDPKRTITVMDLGGGSTQATFLPQQMESLQHANTADLQDIDIGNEKKKLWTHSYLGLGLMSGRLQTLGGKEGDQSQENPNEFQSPCFPSGYRTYWFHGARNYSIVGLANVDNRADECYAVAQRVIHNQINVPAELITGNIMLISYYFDRAVEAKLINGTEGGDLKVSDYITAAQTACGSSSKDIDFLCLDLSYISALLRDGFKLGPDHRLTIRKRIEDREISWALGAMFKLLKSPKREAQGG